MTDDTTYENLRAGHNTPAPTPVEKLIEALAVYQLPLRYEDGAVVDARGWKVAHINDVWTEGVRQVGEYIATAINEHADLASECRRLREALSNVLDCLDVIEKDTQGVFTMAAIHGMAYKGRNWRKEYKGAREALGETKP